MILTNPAYGVPQFSVDGRPVRVTISDDGDDFPITTADAERIADALDRLEDMAKRHVIPKRFVPFDDADKYAMVLRRGEEGAVIMHLFVGDKMTAFDVDPDASQNLMDAVDGSIYRR